MANARVVVLGGGFGGVYAARRLERLKAAGAPLDVTLVSRDNFFLFTPMLHEVAASDLDITHIVSPLRTLLRRSDVFVGDIEAIDLERREVRVAHGVERHVHVLSYDHLVIALGSVTNVHGVPGLDAHALTMKTLGDAIDLRNRVIAALEEAGAECGTPDEELLTFVVAGGGFAGVETIGALNDFVRDAARYYPRLRERRPRFVLVHGGAEILPELGALGAYARARLEARGIEVVTGVHVASVDERGVSLADGRFVATRLLVWTAGTSPHPLVASLPCARRGRIAVGPALDVPGLPGVWALGDCAIVPDTRSGGSHPPTAQHAIRQARTAADNIAASVAGRPLRSFDFRTIGQLAAIGRRTGVARIFGRNFSGFVAWWLWRTIYLAKLPRFDRKVRVALDWTLDLLFAKDFVQFLTVRGAAASADAAPSTRASSAERVSVR